MISLKSKEAYSILTFFNNHRDQKIYINELSRMLNLDSGNMYRKLQEFEKEGVLISEKKGHQKYYSLNIRSELLDVYVLMLKHIKNRNIKTKKSKLPKYFQGVLWSYKINYLDIEKDKKKIITNSLIYGTSQITDWIFNCYDENDIRDCVLSPLKGEWDKKSLSFWSKMLKIPQRIYDDLKFKTHFRSRGFV